MVFENKVPNEIFGLQMDEVRGERKKNYVTRNFKNRTSHQV